MREDAASELTAHTRIQCALDAKERPLHCHHEKTIVIDDRVAFVGGIDLTSEAGDRFDSSDHPARAIDRLARRLRADRRPGGAGRRRALPHALARGDERDAAAAAGTASPPATPSCRSCAPFRSTSTRGCREATSGSSSPTAARSDRAQRLIYLENQFLWSPEIAAVLVDKLAGRPTPTSGCSSSCRHKPNNGSDDTRGVLGELIEADDDNGRLLACTLYARSGNLFDPIYVHAKIGIVDDRG